VATRSKGLLPPAEVRHKKEPWESSGDSVNRMIYRKGNGVASNQRSLRRFSRTTNCDNHVRGIVAEAGKMAKPTRRSGEHTNCGSSQLFVAHPGSRASRPVKNGWRYRDHIESPNGTQGISGVGSHGHWIQALEITSIEFRRRSSAARNPMQSFYVYER